MRERLFSIRPLKGISIEMFEIGTDNRGAARVEVVVRDSGRMVFGPDAPGMRLIGALSPMHSSDGADARAFALDYAAMRPGDTDDDFFSEYTPEQLAWVERHADALSMAKYDRYGDR